jgi:hypothetical protein
LHTTNTNNISNTSNTNNTNKKKFTPPAFNIQIDVGDGDHIAFFGGSTNVDVKVCSALLISAMLCKAPKILADPSKGLTNGIMGNFDLCRNVIISSMYVKLIGG